MVDKSVSNTKPFHKNDPQYHYKAYILFETLYECEHLLFVLGHALVDAIFKQQQRLRFWEARAFVI
jgi:hypothetical protein